MTKWPSDRVTEWPSDQESNDQETDWVNNWVIGWQEASQTIDRMVYLPNKLIPNVHDHEHNGVNNVQAITAETDNYLVEQSQEECRQVG